MGDTLISIQAEDAPSLSAIESFEELVRVWDIWGPFYGSTFDSTFAPYAVHKGILDDGEGPLPVSFGEALAHLKSKGLGESIIIDDDIMDDAATLAQANDLGASFKDIAELIRQYILPRVGGTDGKSED